MDFTLLFIHNVLWKGKVSHKEEMWIKMESFFFLRGREKGMRQEVGSEF